MSPVKMMLVFLFWLFSLAAATKNLNSTFEWKQITFEWHNEERLQYALNSGNYIPENNLPLGLEVWNNKVFVTVPSLKRGVISTLNYINLDSDNKSPSLIPYPDWKSNYVPRNSSIHKSTEYSDDQILSVYRVRIDVCDRLWFMDPGLINLFDNMQLIRKPAIVVYDLKTDKLLRRYELKDSEYSKTSMMFNLVVDVTEDSCESAFAYFTDSGDNQLLVYSWAENDSWKISHNFFNMNPLMGELNVNGTKFVWHDGIFGLALGPIEENGFRTVYFHPLISTMEFSVNSRVLQSKTLSLDYHSYHIEGNTGNSSQSSVSVLDEKTNVLFLTQIQRNGLACWNTNKILTPENVSLVLYDEEKYIFNNEIILDANRNLWMIPNRMPIFLYGKLNTDDVNFRIFKVGVDELIQGTVCEE